MIRDATNERTNEQSNDKETEDDGGLTYDQTSGDENFGFGWDELGRLDRENEIRMRDIPS